MLHCALSDVTNRTAARAFVEKKAQLHQMLSLILDTIVDNVESKPSSAFCRSFDVLVKTKAGTYPAVFKLTFFYSLFPILMQNFSE